MSALQVRQGTGLLGGGGRWGEIDREGAGRERDRERREEEGERERGEGESEKD